MSGATALDHVGVVAHDLDMLADQFVWLGFTLTPFARTADGRIGNRCVMLRQGYIELMAVVAGSAGSATLERFLARYAGIHVLAFAVDDTRAETERLRRAGIDAPPVSELTRTVDDAEPDVPRARFAVIPLPEQAEGRINFVHHLTPDVLWQERFLHHRNNATALAEVVVAVANTAESAARFSRLVGCVVVPDPLGGFALDLPRGRVRLVPGDALRDVAVTRLPCIAGLTVRTADANDAIARLLGERGVPHLVCGPEVLVEPSAGGVALRFAAE